jgi:hypothetical protein
MLLGFRYYHKVENKYWEAVDFKELEDIACLQWLIDENLLTDKYDLESGFVVPQH